MGRYLDPSSLNGSISFISWDRKKLACSQWKKHLMRFSLCGSYILYWKKRSCLMILYLCACFWFFYNILFSIWETFSSHESGFWAYIFSNVYAPVIQIKEHFVLKRKYICDRSPYMLKHFLFHTTTPQKISPGFNLKENSALIRLSLRVCNW